MTPAQRQYDLDLVKAMYKMASQIEPRSRKVSDVLKIAAARIAALASSLPDENKIQPASTPDQNR